MTHSVRTSEGVSMKIRTKAIWTWVSASPQHDLLSSWADQILLSKHMIFVLTKQMQP